MGECDTHCLAGGSLGSFYKHPLKKEKKKKSGYSSIIWAVHKSTGDGENGGEGWIIARGCFGFEVKEFVYSYRIKKLTVPWPSDALSYNMCICLKYGRKYGVVLHAAWEGLQFSRYFCQC